MNFILDNFAAICSVVVALASIVATLFGVKVKNGKTSATFAAIKLITALLPKLITFSEVVNEKKTGEEKKTFVMGIITELFTIMGVTVSDEVIAEISENVDTIVEATKNLHVKGSPQNENLRNDIGTVTGLRIEA